MDKQYSKNGRRSVKKLLWLTVIVFAIFIFLPKETGASGCSQYGIMSYESGGYCYCMSGYRWGTSFLGGRYCVSNASYCRDEYGYGSTSDYSGSCKCRYGYVWGKDIFGRTKCVDANQDCRDKYGYGSSYDSLSEQCECISGYVFDSSSSTCVSGNTYCSRKFGYGSQYDRSSSKCECSYGYEFTINILGKLECTSCFSKYGLHSRYDSLSKKCECSPGYTVNDNNQCVEKQNNVYFKLKELDTDNRKAIIQSEYDNKYYLVEYNFFGCLSFSFQRYLNKKIVVNLGTDFNLDRNDKIVLYDHNQTCEIKSVERVDSIFSLLTEDSKKNIIFNINENTIKIDTEMTNRLRGKILLQIESHGEAWYVNFKDGKRYYMADGDEAYRVMRYLGVGITNKDLDKIKISKTFAKKNSGKIFLQVESHGEAYYIDFSGGAHYLKDGVAAYSIMRDLGLGITNNNLNKISEGILNF